MRFLVDECTGPAVAVWLQKQAHDVFSVYDEARGLDDESIIQLAGQFVVASETKVRFASKP